MTTVSRFMIYEELYRVWYGTHPRGADAIDDQCDAVATLFRRIYSWHVPDRRRTNGGAQSRRQERAALIGRSPIDLFHSLGVSRAFIGYFTSITCQ